MREPLRAGRATSTDSRAFLFLFDPFFRGVKNGVNKNNMLKKSFLTVSLAAAFLIVMCSGMGIQESKKKPPKFKAPLDSLVFAAVGDSVYSVIMKGNPVEARTIPVASDSVQTPQTIKIKRGDRSILNFILSDPHNFKNSTVYGTFMPQFEVIVVNRQTRMKIKYDFGLRKWAICNSQNETLQTYDLVSDDMLRYASQLFPENNFYKQLLIERTK